MRIEDDIPNIEAQCAKCGALYDLRYALACPVCQGVAVRYARLVPKQEAQGMMSDSKAWDVEPIRKATGDYPGRLSSPYAHTTKEQRDIAELDRMFALEDHR